MAHGSAALIGVGTQGKPRAPGQRCSAAAEGFVDTFTFRVAVPGTVTDAGLELQLTPGGAPPHANVTGPVKPFVEFSKTVNLAEPPTLIVAAVGLIDAVNPDTTNCVETACVVPPPVPTTLTAYVPGAMVPGRLTVSVEVAADVERVTVGGLNEHATPAGGFEQLSVTL